MTNRKKPKVYITRRLPDVVETRMRELFDAELNIEDRPRTQPELVAAVKTHDVLVPTVTDRIDAALIEQAGPQLRLIASFSNGVRRASFLAMKVHSSSNWHSRTCRCRKKYLVTC